MENFTQAIHILGRANPRCHLCLISGSRVASRYPAGATASHLVAARVHFATR